MRKSVKVQKKGIWPFAVIDGILIFCGISLQLVVLPLMLWGLLFTDSPDRPYVAFHSMLFLAGGMGVIDIITIFLVVLTLRKRMMIASIALSFLPTAFSPLTILLLLG